MKKIIYIVLILVVLCFFFKDNNTYLPEDSIRFRIIPSSNASQDQALKMNIKKELETNLFELVADSKSAEETRQIIKENETTIKETLDKYNIKYNIKYGTNYFPTKEFDGVTYEEGNYESLVIELGEAKGNNWWCVMYPPLCLLEDKNKEEKVEYTSFIGETLSKLIK